MDLVTDPDGSVLFGWAGPNVFYSHYTGTLSSSLGAVHVEALQAALASVSSLRYFADSSELTSYDLLARSALVRLLLSNRKKFSAMIILHWDVGLSAPGRALVDAVGSPLVVLEDRGEFERQLSLAAPLSFQAIRSARRRGESTPPVALIKGASK